MAASPEIQAVLKRYGLDELAGWAALMAISGASPDAIELSLYDQPAFRTRFKGIFDLEAAGKPPISPEEYLEYEQSSHALARSYGISLTKDEVDKMIGGAVSVREAEQRITFAGQAMYESSPEVRAELKRLYNVTDGQLSKYWMDPKIEAAKLQQRFVAARLSASATSAGYDQLSAAEGERLASSGLTEEGATSGFQSLVKMQELFRPIDITESAIDREAQLGFLATGAGAEELEKRARKRTAEFEEGGEFATGSTGIAGLGSAAT